MTEFLLYGLLICEIISLSFFNHTKKLNDTWHETTELSITTAPNSLKFKQNPSKQRKLTFQMASQSQSSLAAQICSEIAAIFTKPTSPHAPPLDLLVTSLAAAASQNAKIFLYGVGREGLMLKALCMRLAHLGLNAHQVFDMNAPPISGPDLLIASAGPGGFSTVDAICSVARSNGGKVLLLTARLDGSAVKCADVICFVPARTMADGEDSAAGLGFGDLVLPMGSLYEGALFVLFEMVVFRLREVLGESAEAVRSRHTNLE